MCKGTKGLCQKVWTQTKILSPNICHFVAILIFVTIDTLFGILSARKGLFWVINSVSWARRALIYSIYCISYIFYGNFCPRRKAANFCHPVDYKLSKSSQTEVPFFWSLSAKSAHFRTKKMALL